MGKRHRRPNSESASLQSPWRGFDSREPSLLGPLHVEPSSGNRWNHPPLQKPAAAPILSVRVEVSSVFVSPKQHAGTTHTCKTATATILGQTEGGARPVFKGIDGGFTDPSAPAGFELPSSRRAPSALPLGQRPPRYVLPRIRGATARGACVHSVILWQARHRRPSSHYLAVLTFEPAGRSVLSIPPSMHSIRPSDLALFALAVRQTLSPAVCTRRP